MRKRRRLRTDRIAIMAVLLLLLIFACRRGYQVYELHRQISEAEVTKQELLQEKADLEGRKAALEGRKAALEDRSVIERKARDDLGMVKPGEVPYVR